MKTLRMDLLMETIGNLYISLFYNTSKGDVESPAKKEEVKKFSFKWDGSYEASLTK